MNLGNHRNGPRRQSGAVLTVAMVILLMLTLVATGAIRLSTRHTQVVNNEQVRTEATTTANYALDMVLNEPASTWTDLNNTTGRVMYVNVGTQQAADSPDKSIQVTVKNMTCKRARLLKNSELVKTSGGTAYIDPADTSCFGGASNTGLTIVDPTAAGTTSDDSNCGTVLYELQAEASDPQLVNAKAKVQQGVEVRTDIATLSTSCS